MVLTADEKIKSVFEAALPLQKHIKANTVRPRADQRGLQPDAMERE